VVLSETHSDHSGYGVSASGATDGFIDLAVVGGTGVYTYTWTLDGEAFATTVGKDREVQAQRAERWT
jgi:hypothetical protein